MTIETKYDLDQELFYITESGIESGIVNQIEPRVYMSGGTSNRARGQTDVYRVSGCNLNNQVSFYPTKQDAAREWLARAGLEPGLQNA